MTELDTEETLTGDARIMAEARRRFEYCESREGECRKLFLEDLKFANGDSNNGYQWPNDIRTNREIDQKPCLTINKTRQHNLQIINDAKQNKPSIKVDPTGNGATYESAEVFEGIIRHIEYASNAQVAYDTASKFQVDAGLGYWRVVTDFVDDGSFDQEIFIRRIKDPLAVYLDPDINEVDGSDALFGFIFDDMKREEFNAAYPGYKFKASYSVLGDSGGWLDDDHVRVAEYYRRVKKTDKLLAFKHPVTGDQHIMRSSAIAPEIAQMVIDDPTTMHRDITEYEVEWFLLIGDEIADRRKWAGSTVPIVRAIGEETIIDGRIDRKGHTRNLKDPQRIYNYWSSAGVEFVALQSKTPFVAPAKAIEGYETYWEAANTKNFSVLPYNHVSDDGGETIPAPERAMPPTYAPAYVEGMKVAQTEMMMVSGQYEATMGQKSNEVSGKAINERQRQGDTATYHFIDNLAIAIRYTGKILIELIPKIYDTPRILRILADDGTESHVQLDPRAQIAYFEKQKQNADAVHAIFNPNVGKYDVQADIGPAYATKRQESFNALSQILKEAPNLVSLVGDLLFKAADFPMAEEVAERLERMVPPQAKGEGIPPAVQQLQDQVEHMQGIMTNLMEQIATEKMKLRGKEEKRDVEAYKAITDRLDVIAKHFEVTPKDKAEMLHDLMREEHQSSLNSVTYNSKEPSAEGEMDNQPKEDVNE